jgi:hypothetical protein
MKRFVSLQFLHLRQSVGLLGVDISPSQGRYLTEITQASMLYVGFEPTFPVFERVKVFLALKCTAAVIGRSSSRSRTRRNSSSSSSSSRNICYSSGWRKQRWTVCDSVRCNLDIIELNQYWVLSNCLGRQPDYFVMSLFYFPPYIESHLMLDRVLNEIKESLV